jgi:SAM-dependent methyltransferase
MDARDPRRYAPAAARNREPIFAVLRENLPAEGAVLEIGAGSGEHAAAFAPRLPGLRWRPTDPDPSARASIDAWAAQVGAANVDAAIDLDAAHDTWPIGQDELAAILAINVVHIAPWPTAEGIFAGAGRHLAAEGLLFLYGPYRIGGGHTAPSNAAFDASLRARDPRWGVRDLEALCALGEAAGLELAERVAMPANNFSLVFRRG